MNYDNWTENNYNFFINYLYSLEDLEYKKFHTKLVLKNNIIGIRTPILKKIAKEISNSDYKNFISLNKHNTYEEIIIHGLVIGYIKADFKTVKSMIDNFICHVDNWAVNDIVVANLKIFKTNKEEGFEYIKELIFTNNSWKIRFGLVLLLNYYIDDYYINKVLEICNEVKNDNYYVKMANAWLISICYIKYPEIVKEFLNTTKIDDYTYNKAISKICDSRRVSKIEKNKLKEQRK